MPETTVKKRRENLPRSPKRASKYGIVNDLGEYNLKSNNFSQAIEYFQRAHDISRDKHSVSHPFAAASLCNIAFCHFSLDDFERATSFLKRVHDNLTSQVSNSEIFKPSVSLQFSLDRICKLFSEKESFSGKNPSKVFKYLQQTLELTRLVHQNHRDFHEHLNIVNTLRNTGHVHLEVNQPIQALECYKESLQLVDKLQNFSHADVEEILKRIGYAFTKMGRTDEGNMFARAIQILNESFEDEENPDIARSLLKIGNLFLLGLGLPHRALLFYEKALRISKNVYVNSDHSIVADCYYCIGDANELMGNETKASENYQKSFNVNQRMNNQSLSTTKTKLALGQSYFRLYEHNKALKYLLQSLDTYTKFLANENQETIAGLNKMIGVTYLRLGQNEEIKAMKYLKQAYHAYKELSNQQGVGEVMHALGEAYMSTRNFQKALFWLNQALEMYNSCHKNGDDYQKVEILSKISKCYSINGDRIKFEKFKTLKDEMENRILEAINTKN